jgi:hypothetical protein
LLSCLGQHGPISSYLCFLNSWNERCAPPCPAFY